MPFVSQDSIKLRGRLVRRVFYRTWKTFSIWRARNLISEVTFESTEEKSILLPTIILASYTKIEDFFVLTHLFKEHDLTLLAPSELPKRRLINQLHAFNQILSIGPSGVDYSFLKQLITSLRVYNRSVVISPGAGGEFLQGFSFDYANLARIAMKTSAPIQPVIIQWGRRGESQADSSGSKCRIFVGKRLFISPRYPDFKDIFFRAQGARKFSRLSNGDLDEIGKRIAGKFNQLSVPYGPNLS